MASSKSNVQHSTSSEIDRTLKFYIGGKQVRPDGGNSIPALNFDGSISAWVGQGNRKDIRNAVEAARKANGWATKTAHLRAQVLYFFAENLTVRKDEFIKRLMETCGVKKPEATAEFNATVSRIFSYAAWADKFDGAAHDAPYRGVTLALPEPIGIIGLVAPDHQPLLAAISLIAPAIAMGNRVVYIPGDPYQNIVLELVSVMETSDIPGGVINIVTGDKDELSTHLAGHGEVESIWCWGDSELNKNIESISVENLKRTWCHENNDRDWLDMNAGEGTEFLRKATHVKNIWTPYGD